ncbi:MAG TPA: DMT family transporter [Anaerolineales bacterium]|nr:DMT family transporter [Anaerolineales bacterium]
MKLWGIVAGLSAAAIWGGMYVVSKAVLPIVPPFLLLSLRLILGTAVLAFVQVRAGRLTSTPREARRIILIGALGFGVSVGLQFVGTSLSTAANASLVTAASPAFILLFAGWILRERITLRRLAALALASFGVVAVIDPPTAGFDPRQLQGNLALLGAAVTWGLYSVLVKQVSATRSTLEVSLLAFPGGLLVSLPMAAIEMSTVGVGPISPAVIAGILYLGIISTALAMYLWNRSLAILEAGVVSLLFFAQPVVGAGLGAALLGESLHSGFWLGALFIGAGLLLSSMGDRPVPAHASEG